MREREGEREKAEDPSGKNSTTKIYSCITRYERCWGICMHGTLNLMLLFLILDL